jgi:hypothetical protein
VTAYRPGLAPDLVAFDDQKPVGPLIDPHLK